MKVILDVNRASSLSYNVQMCSSVEGFIELMKIHPEDEFEIDKASADAYVDYMRAQHSVETLWENFCEEMCISKDEYDAMVNYYQNVEPALDPVHDKKL